jgi:heme/copper-type cytochrome/quinol oxidase subunit 4
MQRFIRLEINQTEFILPMETNLSRQIKFIILLSIQIPSIICYLFLLYHLLFKRSMRRSLNNHVFILICFIGLITILIDLSMILDYLRR